MLKRFPVFISGSAIGSGIDYIVTLSATNWIGLDPTYALALAMIISASIVYVFHARFTFADSTVGEAKNSFIQAYVFFIGWSVLIFILRVILLKVLLYLGLQLAIALLIAMALISIVNFAISSALIFAKKAS